jgi:hypothetical protein
MKLKNLLIVLAIMVQVKTYAQSNSFAPLKYISYYPIKTEDGCGFFSDNVEALNKKKYLLIIAYNMFANKPVAYIQTGKDSFIYFTRVKRTLTKKGYVDFYKEKGKGNAFFELTINEMKKNGLGSSFRNGKLLIKVNNIKKELDVFGDDNEVDRYNNPELFKQKK